MAKKGEYHTIIAATLPLAGMATMADASSTCGPEAAYDRAVGATQEQDDPALVEVLHELALSTLNALEVANVAITEADAVVKRVQTLKSRLAKAVGRIENRQGKGFFDSDRPCHTFHCTGEACEQLAAYHVWFAGCGGIYTYLCATHAANVVLHGKDGSLVTQLERIP